MCEYPRTEPEIWYTSEYNFPLDEEFVLGKLVGGNAYYSV